MHAACSNALAHAKWQSVTQQWCAVSNAQRRVMEQATQFVLVLLWLGAVKLISGKAKGLGTPKPVEMNEPLKDVNGPQRNPRWIY